MLSSFSSPQSIWQAATVNFSFAIVAVPTGASGGEPEALTEFNFLEVGAMCLRGVICVAGGVGEEEKKADAVVDFAASESKTGLILLAAATNIPSGSTLCRGSSHDHRWTIKPHKGGGTPGKPKIFSGSRSFKHY